MCHIQNKFIKYWLSYYPVQLVAFTTKANFNCFSTTLTSKMFNQQVKIYNATRLAGLCTKQLAMYFKHCYSNPFKNLTHARDIIGQASAIAVHFIQVTVATTVGSIPRALVIKQDMFLNFLLIADWQVVVQCYKQYVNNNICHVN